MMDTDTACARQQVMLRANTEVTQHFKEETGREEGRDRRRGEAGFVLFTRHTHHPLWEHRCLNKDNPRVDPVCTWSLYPG